MMRLIQFFRHCSSKERGEAIPGGRLFCLSQLSCCASYLLPAAASLKALIYCCASPEATAQHFIAPPALPRSQSHYGELNIDLGGCSHHHHRPCRRMGWRLS